MRKFGVVRFGLLVHNSIRKVVKCVLWLPCAWRMVVFLPCRREVGLNDRVVSHQALVSDLLGVVAKLRF